VDSYLNIRLLPDPEFPPSTLMNALYSKLHRALVELKNADIGVSFPEVDQNQPALGSLLRLHGTKNGLSSLMETPWLKGMRDHVEVSGVMPVPDEVEYIAIRRVQAKSNPERLRRRLMLRHNLTAEEAQKRIPESVKGERLKLPHLNLKSQSTDQHFRLFIKHHRPQESSVPGSFNTYGLSPKGTVPWF
jgi:CRISPR-associated endonuclease Csy4